MLRQTTMPCLSKSITTINNLHKRKNQMGMLQSLQSVCSRSKTHSQRRFLRKTAAMPRVKKQCWNKQCTSRPCSLDSVPSSRSKSAWSHIMPSLAVVQTFQTTKFSVRAPQSTLKACVSVTKANACQLVAF